MLLANNEIFSRAALDKLRSPDKLETMIQVTSPVTWMGLAAFCVLFFSVILWSFMGAFTVKAEGIGLIMDSAGVVNISHVAPGKLTELYITNGSHVKKGDLIARMEQPEQSADTRMSQFGMGLAANDRDVLGRVYQYDAKRYQQSARENIYSDYDGIVTEVMVEPGKIIGAGSPICTVRLTEQRDELNGVLYIPVDMGKRVEPGMVIQLAPNGVDTSQSGSLVGIVRSVSQYPVSMEGVQKGVGNARLAQWILDKGIGVAMEVRFDLVKNPESPSGYLWTSIVGKHKPVTAGSYCTGSIIVDRQPPIEKVFYKFSQWLRSR